MTREQILRQDAALRVYQERADAALAPWGIRAPPPTVSDDPAYAEKYRRNLAAIAKYCLPEDHALRNYNLKNPTKTPLDIFEVVEPQVFQACRDSALRNDTPPPARCSATSC